MKKSGTVKSIYGVDNKRNEMKVPEATANAIIRQKGLFNMLFKNIINHACEISGRTDERREEFLTAANKIIGTEDIGMTRAKQRKMEREHKDTKRHHREATDTMQKETFTEDADAIFNEIDSNAETG